MGCSVKLAEDLELLDETFLLYGWLLFTIILVFVFNVLAFLNICRFLAKDMLNFEPVEEGYGIKVFTKFKTFTESYFSDFWFSDLIFVRNRFFPKNIFDVLPFLVGFFFKGSLLKRLFKFAIFVVFVRFT